MSDESGFSGLYVVTAVVILGVAAIYFLKEGILKWMQSKSPNKDAPTNTQTGTTATGDPIVGSDIRYVNPVICALLGKSCNPNENNTSTADPTSANPNINPNIVGMFKQGAVVEQRHQDGSVHGYIVTQPNEAPFQYCEPDPMLQMQHAMEISARKDKGLQTYADMMWAKKCEPALYSMMGGDIKAEVLKSAGVV